MSQIPTTNLSVLNSWSVSVMIKKVQEDVFYFKKHNFNLRSGSIRWLKMGNRYEY